MSTRAAEMRAFGNGHARRDDVAVHGSVVADVDLLGGGDVAGHLAEDDDRLREDLCLDLSVGPNRQHMVAQLNGSFDLTLDGQILAAVQFALDDDRFADVHDISLHILFRLGPGWCSGSGWLRRRRGGWSCSEGGQLHRVST